MSSIQLRLTVRLLVCVLAISVAGSLAVYFMFRQGMVRQFDDGLQAEAHSIATMFIRHHDGSYEFNAPPDIDRMFHHGNDADVWCIRRMNGALAVKSRSLGPRACPGARHPATFDGFHTVHEPGDHEDHNWRAAFLTFVPAAERGVATERFQIIVAAEREEVAHLLKTLLWALALVALVAGAATVLLVLWTVRTDLAPLRELARQAGSIDDASLETRFSLSGAPRELDPILRALNGLLARMQSALKREKRFNADVAHELRTPVAELRSLAEVALAAPDTRDNLVEALADTRDIAAQMESVISALLALRRREAVAVQSLDLVPIVKEVCQGAEETSAGRGLQVFLRLPGEARATTDRTILVSVLRNLFDNAVAYTLPGGEIACAVEPRDAVVQITIRNRPHDLTADDVAHLFEPFWRKEQARSDGTHVGLGLALAESYCRSLGGSLRAEFDEDWIAFTVELPAA